jgi:hypothetical protein
MRTKDRGQRTGNCVRVDKMRLFLVRAVARI